MLLYVILKDGPNRNGEDAKRIVWEHGRRNFALSKGWSVADSCPVSNDVDISGFGIFDSSAEETKS